MKKPVLSKVEGLLVFGSIFVLLIFTVSLLGCRATQPARPSPEKAKRIKISGSRTCLPLMEILAHAYEKKHPDVDIIFLPGAHSSAGIQGVQNNTLDIGSVSRELKPEEAQLSLTYKVVSNDGLAIFTNQQIKLSNITIEQAKGIYAGTITKWKEVGGPDAKIVVLDRAEDESAKIILRKYVIGDTKTTAEATVLYFESDMVEALKTTPNAIGYLSLGYSITKSLPLNVLSLDGVRPSEENVHNGSYKVVRPLGIVYKKGPKGPTKDFLDFIFSKEGKKVMEKNGYAAAS